MKGKTTTSCDAKADLREIALELENSHQRSQKSLIRNIAITVLSAVILNAGATFFTTASNVKRNTDRIERIEKMTESQEELKEFVAALQIQYMYANDEIEENTAEIKLVREKIDKFIEKYYSSTQRGAVAKLKQNSGR